VFACTTALGRLRAVPVEGEVELRRLTCAGRLNAGMVMESFEDGAERVLVLGCQEADCRHRDGARLATGQVRLARELVATLGFDPARVGIELVDRDGCSQSLAETGEPAP
jgi:coenzyme F420-reducing hydrogenase delta subunit